MKRIVSILLVMALMITMAVPAFANDGTGTMYTTTTTNAYASPDLPMDKNRTKIAVQQG